MFCPNCSTLCPDSQRFCTRCGTDLHPELGEVLIPKVPRKRRFRWIPIVLAVLLALSAIGTGLFFLLRGLQPRQVKDGWFTLKDGILYFDESQYIGGSELTVPSEINGEPVLSLGEGCFAGCDTISTVILPDTLMNIGSGSFENCTALRGIYIPESVTVISSGAFRGCTALEAIHIPTSVSAIGAGAFDDCNKLHYIFYPGSIDEWDLLYDEFITPYTGVFCDEGSFYHGGDPNS